MVDFSQPPSLGFQKNPHHAYHASLRPWAAGCGHQGELAEGFGRRAQKRRRAGGSGVESWGGCCFRGGNGGFLGWFRVMWSIGCVSELGKYVLSMIFHMIWKWIHFCLHIWTSQSSITVWKIQQLILHDWWLGKTEDIQISKQLYCSSSLYRCVFCHANSGGKPSNYVMGLQTQQTHQQQSLSFWGESGTDRID